MNKSESLSVLKVMHCLLPHSPHHTHQSSTAESRGAELLWMMKHIELFTGWLVLVLVFITRARCFSTPQGARLNTSRCLARHLQAPSTPRRLSSPPGVEHLLVDVEAQRHALQHPVAGVLGGGQVRLQHQPHAHGVAPALGHVHRGLEGVLQLELGRLDGDHLQDGQLGDQHLGVLAPQHAALHVPRRALQVQPLDVAPVLQLLAHLRRLREARHLRVQRGLVQRPLLGAARRLHQRRRVRLGDVQPRQPHHRGLALLHPHLVLLVAALEPQHPAAQLLLRGRRHLGPGRRQRTVEQRGGQHVQVAAHADLAAQRLLQVLERAEHARYQLVVAVQLLQQHHLARRGHPHRLLDHLHVERRRQLGQDVAGHAADEVLAADAPAAARHARLQVDQVGPDVLGGVGVVRDVGVAVQPERLGRLHDGQAVDDAGVRLSGAVLRHHVVHLVVLEEVERLERVEQEVAQVLVQVRVEDAAVVRVRHAPAIHRLADQVPQRAPRQHVVLVLERLGEVRVDQQVTDAEVRLVEVVGDVPAQLAVLAALLHHGVEERQHVRQRPEPLVRALGQGLLGDLGVGRAHVELQAVGGLRHHLQRALQDAQGEAVRGVGGEPQAEVLVRLGDLLEDLLQRLEPAGQQVAVLQHDPQPARGAHLQHLRSLGPHALAQRHELELGAGLVAHLLAQAEHVEGGVRARAQHEHHGGHGVAHRVDVGVVQDGRLHVLLAHGLDDVAGDGHGDAVHAHAAQQQHLLEHVQRLRVPAGERRLLGRLELVPLLPGVGVLLHVVGDAGEGAGRVGVRAAQRHQPDQVLPPLLRPPLVRLLALGLLQAQVALEEEVQLLAVEAPLALLHLDGHLERQHELVHLEQAQAREVVHVVGERLHHVAQPALQTGVLLASAQRQVEHLQVHVQ
mmetsp:Transcript_14108/g.33880  ORF Transcript_14108/g.33880 Transcript_14108/m.33880 type:complete len:904 (+) Transcript_14108:88-2799(+)